MTDPAVEIQSRIDNSQAVKDLKELTDAMQDRLGSAGRAIRDVLTADIGGTLKNIAAGVGVAATGAAVGLFALAKHSASVGDETATLASRLHVSTEFLTRTEFAAKQSGASMEDLTKALTKVSVGAVNGSENFRRWGVDIRDSGGKLKTQEALFDSAAKKIQGIKDPIERVTAATDLFGKSGVNLVPMIENLEEVRSKADELGITLSTAVAQQGADFSDNLDAIGDALGATARIAGETFLPVLSKAFDNLLAPIGALNRAIQENKLELQTMARDGAVLAVEAVASLVRGFGFFVEMIDNARANILDLRVGWLSFKESFTFSEEGQARLRDALGDLAVQGSELEASARRRQEIIAGAALVVDDFAGALREVNIEEANAAKATAASTATIDGEAIKRREAAEAAKAHAAELARIEKEKAKARKEADEAKKTADAENNRLKAAFDREYLIDKHRADRKQENADRIAHINQTASDTNADFYRELVEVGAQGTAGFISNLVTAAAAGEKISFGKFFGSILVQLGNMAIAMGTVAVAGGLLGQAVPIFGIVLGGAAAVAAGAGLIAAGALAVGAGTVLGGSGGGASSKGGASSTKTTAGAGFGAGGASSSSVAGGAPVGFAPSPVGGGVTNVVNVTLGRGVILGSERGLAREIERVMQSGRTLRAGG